MNTQKIIPNLWFDRMASEAVPFYTAIFPDSKIEATSYYPKSSADGLADFQKEFAGKELAINFALADYQFTAINAGSEFVPTPANSFMLNFDPSEDKRATEHLEQIWRKLTENGHIRMPLDSYSFSKQYGWVEDKYHISWQLILTDPTNETRPFIIPAFTFGGDAQNRALEAIDYYVSVFKKSKKGMVAPYTTKTGPANAVSSLMFADFMLENQWFAAMDSGVEQAFSFTEAISFSIACQNQAEIDYYWEKLSTHPENEQCGWCKDQFGVSWQIVPNNMPELMKKPGAYTKMMDMKKIVIAEFNHE